MFSTIIVTFWGYYRVFDKNKCKIKLLGQFLCKAQVVREMIHNKFETLKNSRVEPDLNSPGMVNGKGG